MRKIFILIGLFVLIGSYNPKVSAATSYVDEVLYKEIEKPNDVISLSGGEIIKYNEYWLYKTTNTELKFNGSLIGYDDTEIGVLFVNKNNEDTILIRIFNGTVNESTLDRKWDIQNIVYENGKIYLFGKTGCFSLIAEYNKDLEYLKEKLFFEESKVLFYDALYYEDKWYVFGLKDGHTLSNEIDNIGNYNDKKTILFIFNNLFDLETIKYFNHQLGNEKAKFLQVENDLIYYYFEIDNTKYLYKSDLKFENNLLVKTSNYSDVLVDINSNYILFNNDNQLMMDTNEEQLELGSFETVYDYKIKDGRLEVYYYNKNNLYIRKISEYHISKLDPITISYEKGNIDFDKDLNVTDEVEIKSYFSLVEVLCNTDFSKNVYGNYNVELLIVRPFHEDIKISNVVNIKPFINITNMGVYCTGYSLNFLGNATLNGMKINSGHSISKSGEYVLNLYDNLGNSNEYKFIVVDNYYIRNNNVKNYDFVGLINKETKISIDLGLENISEVFVNGESVKFVQNEGILELFIPSSSQYGVKEYIINKIVINEKDYLLDYSFTINTLKSIPEVDIIENNNKIPDITYLIEDKNQTVKYLEVCIKNEFINNSYYYFFNDEIVIDNNEFESGQIMIYLCYDLGDGLIRKELLTELSGSFKDIKNLIMIESIVEGELLKQFNVKINLENVNKLNSLIISDKNIVSNYSIEKNHTSLIISLILTCIIIVTVFIYWLIKRRKIKKI